VADVEGQDRRSIRRFELQLPVTVTVTAKSGEQLQVAAKSRDVSSHGICFYCDAELERDSAIEFTVTLPADVTMTEPVCVRCSGKVVRVEKSSGSDKFAVAAEIGDYEFVVNNDKQNRIAGADAPPRL
jgi:uncharacterized protein with PIN domain